MNKTRSEHHITQSVPPDLSHGGEEPLRVEESRHPEGLRPAAEQPHLQLAVPLEQLGEPESQRARVPRDLNQQRMEPVRTQTG